MCCDGYGDFDGDGTGGRVNKKPPRGGSGLLKGQKLVS